jgi:hypothetical protein
MPELVHAFLDGPLLEGCLSCAPLEKPGGYHRMGAVHVGLPVHADVKDVAVKGHVGEDERLVKFPSALLYEGAVDNLFHLS